MNSEEERASSRFKIALQHPENFADALRRANKTFELQAKGLIPESIAGWLVTVACMRILRCVYGDNLAVAVAIRKYVLDGVAAEVEYERRTR